MTSTPRTLVTLTALLLAVALAGCAEDGISPDALAGTWEQAGVEFTFTAGGEVTAEDPNHRFTGNYEILEGDRIHIRMDPELTPVTWKVEELTAEALTISMETATGTDTAVLSRVR